MCWCLARNADTKAWLDLVFLQHHLHTELASIATSASACLREMEYYEGLGQWDSVKLTIACQLPSGDGSSGTPLTSRVLDGPHK